MDSIDMQVFRLPTGGLKLSLSRSSGFLIPMKTLQSGRNELDCSYLDALRSVLNLKSSLPFLPILSTFTFRIGMF
jgi:hypothetical protein